LTGAAQRPDLLFLRDGPAFRVYEYPVAVAQVAFIARAWK
jgi:hypothetical protein